MRDASSSRTLAERSSAARSSSRGPRHAVRHRVDLAFRLHVLPEGDDVAAVPVWAGIEQSGRRYDRSSGTSGVGRYRELADDVLLGRALGVWSAAGDARDERQRPEMDE